MTLYDLKPRFQALLRPLVAKLAARGVTANQVTFAALAGSVLVGAAAMPWAAQAAAFLLIPAWLFLRMALNAIDGMLAREFHQKSVLGAYLNELSDVASDAALYTPFCFVAPFAPGWVLSVVGLSALSEFAGALGPSVGASRRNDGPLGKSDRAFVFGALGLWVGVGGPMPEWLAWLMPVLAALLCLTIVNRIRHGVREAR